MNTTKPRGGQWIRQVTRWSIYLRDNLSCLYCGRTAPQVLLDPDGFLTLDHVVTAASGGDHSPANVVTACFTCNRDRNEKSLRAFCQMRGFDYPAVQRRVWTARRKDVEQYRAAARVLLGAVPGIPRAELVMVMTWRAKRQWAGWQEKMMWAADREPCCEACLRPFSAAPTPLEPEEDFPPF